MAGKRKKKGQKGKFLKGLKILLGGRKLGGSGPIQQGGEVTREEIDYPTRRTDDRNNEKP